MAKYSLIVVGSGTAGIIAATLAKYIYKLDLEVILISDSKTPSIGVGESLTPVFTRYLDFVGISKEELIQNANCTIKLGLKFKNWKNDGKHYYHGFDSKALIRDPSVMGSHSFNLAATYDIIHNQYELDRMYDPYFYENCVLPNMNVGMTNFYSLHIDATLFSKYVENKFKKDLTIIDDFVQDVIVDEKTNTIKELVLKKKGKIKADFYIDASGFAAVLMSKLKNKWVDKTDWLPLNRFIPNPVPTKHAKLPNYTTSEATDDGWILQVPLQNRWGSGYLYSSEFTTDEQAFKKFNIWSKTNYNSKVKSDKVLKFESGYWQDGWVGNCLSVGLSHGFAEPLEATNIHQVVDQLLKFFFTFNFQILNYDVNNYNSFLRKYMENIFLYLRYCYCTDRTDSKFWKYMTNNVPDVVKDLDEKSKNFVFNYIDLPTEYVFSYHNFTAVAYGLGKYENSKQKMYDVMVTKNQLKAAKDYSDKTNDLKTAYKSLKLYDHKQYIDHVVTYGFGPT